MEWGLRLRAAAVGTLRTRSADAEVQKKKGASKREKAIRRALLYDARWYSLVHRKGDFTPLYLRANGQWSPASLS